MSIKASQSMLKNLFAKLKHKQENTSKDVNAFKESEKKKLEKEDKLNEV